MTETQGERERLRQKDRDRQRQRETAEILAGGLRGGGVYLIFHKCPCVTVAATSTVSISAGLVRLGERKTGETRSGDYLMLYLLHKMVTV